MGRTARSGHVDLATKETFPIVGIYGAFLFSSSIYASLCNECCTCRQSQPCDRAQAPLVGESSVVVELGPNVPKW